MTFARIWPSGIGDKVSVSGAQFTQIDLNISRAIDGYAGGKSSPIAKIVISGAGLQASDTNECAPFVTKDAKWLGAVLDFETGDFFLGGQIQDACGPKEGFVVVVSNSTNDNLYQSYDGGRSFEHVLLSVSDTFQCCASTPPTSSSAGTVLVGCGSPNMYYSLGTANYAVWIALAAGGSATSIDAIHYDSVNNQFVAIGKTGAAPFLSTITAVGIPAVTVRTVPAAITGSNSGLRIAQNPVSGRMVASWANQTKFAYSDDGITWTASTTSVTSGSYALSFGDGVFLAVDTTARNNIWQSTDGITWTHTGVTMPAAGALAMATPHAFANINGVFLVSYPTGNHYYSIDAGATWHLIQHMWQASPTKYDATYCVRAIHNRLYLLMGHIGGSVVVRSRKLGSALGGG